MYILLVVLLFCVEKERQIWGCINFYLNGRLRNYKYLQIISRKCNYLSILPWVYIHIGYLTLADLATLFARWKVFNPVYTIVILTAAHDHRDGCVVWKMAIARTSFLESLISVMVERTPLAWGWGRFFIPRAPRWLLSGAPGAQNHP